MAPLSDDPAGPTPWQSVRDRLGERPADQLSADELDQLSDALFWLDQVHESMAIRRMAYRAHAPTDPDRAAWAAWRLFYEHFLVGEDTLASGWLERCRSHVAIEQDTTMGAWFSLACADVATRSGDHATALQATRHAAGVARRLDDADLLAMARQAQGRAEIAAGNRAPGLALLDAAMVDLLDQHVSPLFTGWVFCNVVSACLELAELTRASQWSEAALRWCDTLGSGRMYPGLCRVYAVELACLHGAWADAEAGAGRACDDLMSFDPRYAGEAFYLVGELRRLQGDLGGAEHAYVRAHELGRVPQPGLALVVAARGAVDEAVTMLHTVLRQPPTGPLRRTQLMAELVDLELRDERLDEARTHAAEFEVWASGDAAPVVRAWLRATAGRVALVEGRASEAYEQLAAAAADLGRLSLPYDAARVRLSASRAAAATGDLQTALLEARSAESTLVRLEAAAADEAAAWLAELAGGPATEHAPGQPDSLLTSREVEVLRLVAAGATNREAAMRLQLSPHTVGRHLGNVYAKLGVGSRAAATAYAVQRGLVADDG